MLDHLLITRNLLAHYRDSEIHNEIGGRMDFPTLSCRTSPTRSRSASRPSTGRPQEERQLKSGSGIARAVR